MGLLPPVRRSPPRCCCRLTAEESLEDLDEFGLHLGVALEDLADAVRGRLAHVRRAARGGGWGRGAGAPPHTAPPAAHLSLDAFLTESTWIMTISRTRIEHSTRSASARMSWFESPRSRWKLAIARSASSRHVGFASA